MTEVRRHPSSCYVARSRACSPAAVPAAPEMATQGGRPLHSDRWAAMPAYQVVPGRPQWQHLMPPVATMLRAMCILPSSEQPLERHACSRRTTNVIMLLWNVHLHTMFLTVSVCAAQAHEARLKPAMRGASTHATAHRTSCQAQSFLGRQHAKPKANVGGPSPIGRRRGRCCGAASCGIQCSARQHI